LRKTAVAAPRILHVEDNPDDRALVERELRASLPAVAIDVALDREEAGKRLDDTEYDVVITDYQLRWGTGREVLDMVKSRCPDCPVLMFTASGNEEIAVDAMKHGLDDYLTKNSGHYALVPHAVKLLLEGRRARNTLRASEARFRALVEALAQIIWTADPSGAVINDVPSWTAFTGQPAEASLGAGWLACVHPEDRETLGANWHSAVQAGRYFERDYRARRADGAWRRMTVRATPVHDACGRVVEWVGMNTDVTEQREAEEALRRSEALLQERTRALEEGDRRKDEFLAMLAHELRNPLAPVRYAVRVLERDAPAPTQKEARAVIDRQVGLMARLLDDLLDVSRVTRNAIELQREWIDLRSVVRDVVSLVRPTIEGLRQHLQLDLPPEPAWAHGDPARLHQIVDNLLQNAVKYSPSGGAIAVELRVEAGELRLKVADEGRGIDAALLPHVFEMFTRGHECGPRNGPAGLGIGLAVVKGLVDLHGGRVTAASAGPGGGATFEGVLPTSPPPRAEPAEPPPVPAAVGNKPRTVVLVVDDNADAVETLALLLELNGYETHTATDGAEALRTAARVRPQVVFMDLGMPTMDGYEAARRMRAQRWGGGIRLVAISGWGQASDVARSRAAGFDAHFAKPVDPDQVLDVLRQRLEWPGGAADESRDDRLGAAAPGETQEEP
jgi:two-component system CheB/CheR fusion protein